MKSIKKFFIRLKLIFYRPKKKAEVFIYEDQ